MPTNPTERLPDRQESDPQEVLKVTSLTDFRISMKTRKQPGTQVHLRESCPGRDHDRLAHRAKAAIRAFSRPSVDVRDSYYTDFNKRMSLYIASDADACNLPRERLRWAATLQNRLRRISSLWLHPSACRSRHDRQQESSRNNGSVMTLIERYILRNVTVAFFACFVALTLVIWITQILRQLDLVTGQGQTLGIFMIVTLLSLPALIVIIAPVAVFIATLYALNKFNGDSELIVMSAAGIPPGRLLRPFMTLGLATFALVGAMTLYLMPVSFNTLRDVITQIRADFVANIVKEGQFTTLDSGITFHYREKSGDALLGIFMQDERNPEKIAVYIAERGRTVNVDNDSFLVLENGSVQQQEKNSRDAAIVTFQRYALNLSVFAANEAETIYRPRERSTAALISPDPTDPVYMFQSGRFRAELHDRFSAPLYCISFMLIAFAALGEARTTRQGRGVAIAVAVVAVGTVRIIGFFATSAIVREPLAVLGIYGAPLVSSAIALFLIFEGPRVRRFTTALAQRFKGRSGTLAAGTKGA